MNRLIRAMPIQRASYKSRRTIPKRMRDMRDPMFDMLECDPKQETFTVVEVGTQWGWWAYRAAKQLPENVVIHSVDPWSEDEESSNHWGNGRTNLQDWAKNVEPWLGKRVFGWRGTSKEIAPEFKNESIDFIFIDGDHRAEALLLDLQLWFPKVKPGSLIIGHDWRGKWAREVRTAVRLFFPKEAQEKLTVDGLHAAPIYLSERGRGVSVCWWVRKR